MDRSPAKAASDEPRRKRTVAMAWNCSDWGGAQLFLLGIAQRLRHEFGFTFVMPKDTPVELVDLCVAAGFRCEFLRHSVGSERQRTLAGRARMHFRKLISEWELVKKLGSGAFEMVHVELGPWQSLVALAALSRRTKVFHTVHNRLPRVGGLRRWSWLLKFFVAELVPPAGIFAANEDAKKSLTSYAPLSYVQRVTVAPAHVKKDELERAESGNPRREVVREEHSISVDAFLVVTVGQFIERKGPWTLLEAAKTLNTLEDGFEFVWLTSTHIPEELLRRVEGYGLGGRFRIIRMADLTRGREDLLRLVLASDCFVQASDVEGLSIAMLEAMYLGVPCVVTDVGGTSEAVTEGETGILIAPGSSSAIVDAVRALKADLGLRERLALGSKRTVEARFTDEKVARIVSDVYRGALGEGR